jgi:hypothetical protein
MTYTAQSHVSYGDTWTAGQHNTMIDNIADGHNAEPALRLKTVVVTVLDVTQALVVEDGIGFIVFPVPHTINNWELISADAVLLGVVSSSGVPTFQIHNVTDSVDMLSTKITVDAGEWSSYTAATPAVVNTSNDVVTSGDRLRFDCDVAGTNVEGLAFILTFQAP